MTAPLIAMCLLLAVGSPSPVVVSPQLLVGEWRSDEGTTYHFYRNGTFYSHAADMGDGGRWRLRSERQLELISVDERDKTGRSAHRETILIERVVHETLYVRRQYGREVWLKQPGV